MRRSDREVKDFDEIVRIMEKCDVCRLALHDEDYPYILPLNFGIQVADGDITLFFHGAREGKKYELIDRNNQASFEMDCAHRLVTNYDTGNCTMEYESVIGNGTIYMVSDEEKFEALNILMAHYPVGKDFKFNEADVQKTTILKLSVHGVTGKRRMVAPGQ